jgi:putative phosphoesterase
MTQTNKNISILQFSDTHIRKSENFNQLALKKTIKKINKLNPNYIIHLGDITEEGTKEDYELSKKLLSKIKKPIIYIIGNHDARNVGYELFPKYFGPLKPVYEDEKVLIVGFDSTIPDRDAGRFGQTSIQALKKTLKEKGAKKTKIVAFHHHLLPIPRAGRERSMILDAGDVLKTILDCKVDLVLNGHRHSANIYKIEDTTVINSGTVSHFKTRLGSNHSFNLINIKPKTYQITVHNIENQTQQTIRKITKKTIPPKLNQKPITKIVQISDTHFTDSNEFQEKTYNQAIKKINQLNPDLIIHCGDVTDDGLSSSYDVASKQLKKIQNPKIIIPGPHDLLHLGHIRFQNKISDRNTTFTDKNKTFTFYSATSAQYDEKEGLIGRSQLKKLIKKIQKIPQTQIKIVAFHHHILPLPYTREKYPIEDAGDVLKDLTDNEVDIILTGHRHIANAKKINQTIVINANTISSKKTLAKHPNSFNLIEIFKNKTITIKEIKIKTAKQQILGTYELTSRKTNKPN